MAQLRALLFDVDGTLAETERDGHRTAFNRAFAESGLDWHWDHALYGELLQITGGRERIAHFAQRRGEGWLRRRDVQEVIAQLHRLKNRYYAELVAAGGIPLREGLRELLRDARDAGLQLGLVTTTSRENLEALLDASLEPDLRTALRLRVTGEDVARKKPDPECYLLALARLGVPAGAALALEDSRNGLRAAAGAGLRCLVVRSHYFAHEFEREACDGAFAVVDGFRQLSLRALQRRFAEAEDCSADAAQLP